MCYFTSLHPIQSIIIQSLDMEFLFFSLDVPVAMGPLYNVLLPTCGASSSESHFTFFLPEVSLKLPRERMVPSWPSRVQPPSSDHLEYKDKNGYA